ncbi:MAG: putative toxin-antitoxin system antitoxin component (TIGR02293 family) [Motiliproteus sp.]|jgi:putative toxin-antitoxin system antitoxin component (TIGR02293 family)
MDVSIERVSEELGGIAVFGHRVLDQRDLVNEIRCGLPYDSLKTLMASFSIANEEVAKPLGISVTTIKRRKGSERLSASVSNNLLSLAQIAALATDVLGNREKASRWLHKPNRSLSGETPLSRLDTVLGYKEVESTLQRIAYGVFG